MSSKERFLYLALLFFCSFYISYLFFANDENYIDGYNVKINKLEHKIDSLHGINHKLNFRVDTLNLKIKYLDKELDLKDNRIKRLKYEINIKVDAVDSFNDDELTKFFTERYRYYKNSNQKTDSTSSN
ncbi:hypothetical protein N9Q43_00770 [bacterium]|nr:hypothetical protein [bacterium]|tara:strand:+ start:254 stop:637 length:384 start_codon:yes stop_codon:yes gene_type:complete